MAKENDIFNSNPKIQNMNDLFQEPGSPADQSATRNVSSSPKPHYSSREWQVAKNASNPRTIRPASARPVKARPIEEDLFETQAILLNRTEPKQVNRDSSVNPRRVQPKEAQPRSVQPKDAGGQPARRQRPQTSPRPQQGEIRPQNADPRRAQQAPRPQNADPRRAQQAAPRPQNADPRRAQQAAPRPQNADPRRAQQAPRPQNADPRRAQQAPRPQNTDPRRAQQAPRPQNTDTRRAQGADDLRRMQGAPLPTEDPGRVNRTTSGRSHSTGGRGRGGKKRSSGFKKFLLIYSGILLVLLIVGMIIFSSFLSSLEKSQPARIASEVADNFTQDKVTSYLNGHKDAINCFGDPAVMIDACAENLKGKEKISYIENKDYRAEAPSYNITADGKTVAKLTLEKDGSGSFGLSKWKMASLDIADYLDTASYEFLAPVGTTITIDGTELDDKFLTGEEAIPEILKTASKYVTVPSFLTYKVAGIPGDPKIEAKDASGKEMKLTATDDKYVIGSETSKEFVDSVKPLVEKALEAWGKHFINMGDNLRSYILEDSDWYTYIFGGPDMDPIMTSLYEFESIADYEFTEFDVGNFIKYTDDCFTADVHYKIKVNFNTDQMSDENQQLDATWVFVTQNDGKDWYIVDCIYK